MYRNMDQWIEIRQRILRQGVSKRQILRETGMHWKTLEKILHNSLPPGYQRTKPARKSKIGPYLDRIRDILKQDKTLPKKQRHTAKRIMERLKSEGFAGGYTAVKEAVRQLILTSQEVFMPLTHTPGEAQVDFGTALVKMAGVLRKFMFFVKAYERECTETFWDGHVSAFKFFKRVPCRISYDNSKVAISKITGSSRKITDGFKQLVSHYLFRYHFCNVARPNEKGVVEGIVKYARLNFMVPVPQVKDFDELNQYLLEGCRDDMNRRLRGNTLMKWEILEEDRCAMQPLPASAFEACRTVSAGVNSELLVRFDRNDYSVPLEYAFRQVTVKGFVERVEICHYNMIIAIHTRCWDKEQQVFDPLHYLPLLERKPGSLPYAKPLQKLKLPECFSIIQQRLEAEQIDGRRQYIRILRLLEKYTIGQLAAAIETAIRLRTCSSDAITQLLPDALPWRQRMFELAGREHLRYVRILPNSIKVYGNLLLRGEVI
ncbi:MAG: Integrase core domain protein [Planctomycetes bacterium ADurb.Bin401]|nr:MAG: Integrase core domain protein [Planctomycetes bacterium ADurb.Bin401]